MNGRLDLQQVRWAVRRVERWLRQRFAASAVILTYHRVIELDSDPQLLAVSPTHFAEHLEVLRKQAHPLRLAEVRGWLANGHAPARGAVVTFDDGYADNLIHAKRLFEAHDVPATVFITAGHLGSRQEFWWDELDRLLLQPGSSPELLRITLGGRAYEWRLDGAASYAPQAFAQHRHWHIECLDDPTPRQAVYRALYGRLHGLPADERRRALDQLRTWAGAPEPGRPSHRTLSVEELLELSASTLVEIGSHTMTHPVLSTLPASLQKREIQQSKAVLEDILGQRVAGFAYPHGASTPETLALVREAGYAYACTTQPDVLWGGEQPLQLPRIVVRNWDGGEFARFLRYWIGA
jgi:peptidoglycan/xylan/chitin deacetylase (PgdA/CDA1 family)